MAAARVDRTARKVPAGGGFLAGLSSIPFPVDASFSVDARIPIVLRSRDTTPKPLPSPQEFPQRDVVIFDGHCKFCRKQVERLQLFDRGGRLSFISLHDAWVAETYPHLEYDRLMEELVVVTRSGRDYGGAAAFRYLTRRLPLLWWLAPVMHIPFSLPIWSWGYRFIARQRYRWGRLDQDCDGGTCHIHFH